MLAALPRATQGRWNDKEAEEPVERATDAASGAARAGAEATMPATVSVEEVGKMLRCGDATVRRLIQSGVLRPVEGRGKVRVRRTEVLALRAGVLPATSDKPGE